MKPAIIGLSGANITDFERETLLSCRPVGVILFARNICDKSQLVGLISDIKSLLGDDAIVMIDQEGGRVARLRPPEWLKHPPARAAGQLFEIDRSAGQRLAWLNGALIGQDCLAAGINVVCAPVLDRLVPGADSVIGDRAFATDPATIAVLARALANGLSAAGVQPVGKHVPGHGQAGCDSHISLPTVMAQSEDDIAPFKALADLPWMMTAHILFPQWDTENPATLSPAVIQTIIRGKIGFNNLLVSDDLAMHALQGDPGALACRAIEAGCDIVLPCNGEPIATRALLEACPLVSDATLAKLETARRMAETHRRSMDIAALDRERADLLARLSNA